MPIIFEGSANIELNMPRGDVHAGMDVFYNPVMTSHRNISVVLLNTISNKNMKVADPLAGSGIRSLRFLKELKKGKMKELYVNDYKDNFPSYFREQLNGNNIHSSNIHVEHKDTTLFLFEQGGFDYIDIDPFGSPNPFLAAAIARISRQGILAVTATDTAALTGTYPKVTRRKYWSTSLKNYMMHELGLRILIRKVQLQGVQFDKALIPILSYSKDHYFRIYFRSLKGKERCDEIVRQHQYVLYNPKTLEHTVSRYNLREGFDYCGPLWAGSLYDEKLLQKMVKNNPFSDEQRFLELLYAESKTNVVGFYDLHEIARKYKLQPLRIEELLKKMHGVRTHFSPTGIKTEISLEELLTIIRRG